MLEVFSLRSVPSFAQGLVRDLRVRWALEEAGLPYDVRPIGPEEQHAESYRALQPFGQVPAYREDGLELFESGAIVLHEAERSEALLPRDPVGRVESRLDALADRLGTRDHVEDVFSAGDLLMTTVLRCLRHTDRVAKRPALDAYLGRCEARPAFQKALADQMSSFETQQPVARV